VDALARVSTCLFYEGIRHGKHHDVDLAILVQIENGLFDFTDRCKAVHDSFETPRVLFVVELDGKLDEYRKPELRHDLFLLFQGFVEPDVAEPDAGTKRAGGLLGERLPTRIHRPASDPPSDELNRAWGTHQHAHDAWTPVRAFRP